MSPVSPAERERIVQALRDGASIHSVAKASGRSKGTVFTIAHESGLERSAATTASAAEARLDYCQANRLALLNRFFDKADALLDDVDSPIGLQQLSVAVAILTDKRRLEDGEATSRAEVNDSRDAARTRLTGRLDELATRRTARRAAS